jgi:hypothetical protein
VPFKYGIPALAGGACEPAMILEMFARAKNLCIKPAEAGTPYLPGGLIGVTSIPATGNLQISTCSAAFSPCLWCISQFLSVRLWRKLWLNQSAVGKAVL